MKILYDYQVFSWQRYGGISRYFYEIINRIVNRSGTNVSLFLGFHINEYGLDMCRNSFSHYYGKKRPAIPKSNKFFSGINRMLFHRFAPNYYADIYHQTYYGTFEKRFSGKRIVTIFDMTHERFPSSFPFYDTTRKNKRKAVSRADGVICISESTKNDVIDYFGIPENKVTVIYLGNSLKSDVTTARLVDFPYILFVGQRHGYKNFSLLMAAYTRSQKINNAFKLICFGGGKFTSSERRLIAAHSFTGHIFHFSGPDTLLANLYKYASALVYPSQYEGFGIPLLEAMHYGCPVLASNTSSLPEVVGDAGLYFNPTDMDDLMFGLDRILFDEPLRKRLRELGYQREKRFGWDRCADETLDFYKKIVNTR